MTVITGIDAQSAQIQQVLLAKEAAETPSTSPLRIQALAQLLPSLDLLERTALYHASDPTDQKALEIVNAQLGRLPVKREGRGITWEELLPPETIGDVVQRRVARIDEAAAHRLGDLQAIRASYRGLIGTARTTIKKALPRGVVAA
jgi:hypothetical protein